jgi:hypothetical protein
MKTWPAFAILLVLGLAPSRAQEKPAPAQDDRVELKLAELEQDVDLTLIREAMLLRGRKGLVPLSKRPTSDEDRRREEEDTLDLEKYIQGKKQDIIERSARLESKKIPAKTTTRGSKPAEADRQGLIEKIQNAQVEVQLLQMQVNLYQKPLDEAINALAEADFAASTDPSQQAKAEAARKRFDKAKAKYVDLSKRLQLEQSKMGEMQMRIGMGGMGGMGGGMGGMGGGFR